MMKKLLTICFVIFCFGLKSQTAAIPESETLPARVVFYVPNANLTQVASLEQEFEKYAQISTAQFLPSHKCLLIVLADVPDPKFKIYAELVKAISQYIPHKEIKIKTPIAFDEINNTVDPLRVVLK